MRRSSWLLALAVLAVLGSVAVPRHIPEVFRPDLFLLLVVFSASRAPRQRAPALCWLIGLAKDLLSAGPLGGYALLYLAAGFAILRVRQSANTRVFLVQALTAFLAAFATEGLHFLMVSVGEGFAIASGDVRTLFMSSLFTALLAPLCFWSLERFTMRRGPGREYRFGTG